MTFLSSWVVHRERYFTRRAADPHRFRGTSLVHMDWHLELLAANGDLYAAPSTWLLARAGNSGGYSVFQTFVANYHAILGQKLAGRGELRDFLQEDLLRGYLPGLVWGMRAGGLGRFEPMDWTNVERMIEQTWPQQLAARAWLSRIARWPRPFAKLAMGWCWLASRVWLNRMRLRLDRGMAA
jgi:hypothetical protein